MNERIKQLAEQAGLRTELWNNPEPFIIYKEDVNNPGGLEKFAELIVRECLDQLLVSDPKEDFDKGIIWSREQIKDHFGVKE